MATPAQRHSHEHETNQLLEPPKLAVGVSSIPARSHIAAIDGLRGVAALSVLAFHLVYLGHFQTTLLNPLRLGYMGVELFFVLSGLCLALPYLRVNARAFSWPSYLQRRFRRIYPPYLLSVVLLLILYAGAKGHPWFEQSGFYKDTADWRSALSALTFFGPKFNPPTWTLVIEARCYLAIPVLLYIQRRFGGWLGLVGSLVLAVIVGNVPAPELGSGSVLWRCAVYLPLFAVGICIAEWTNLYQHTTLFRWWPAGLALGVAAVLWLHQGSWNYHDPTLARALSVGLLAASILVGALSDTWLRRMCEAKWLAGAGQFSYSLYLVHQPLIYLFQAALPSVTGWVKVAYYLGVIAPGCVLFGYCFYRIAERPFLRRTASPH